MENLLNTKDFKDVRCISLQLGPECNMQCRHCHQTPDKGVKDFSLRKPSKDVLQFIDNFIQYSQREEFKKRSVSEGFLFTVQFYGGEPLLHWQLIKKMVEDFTAKYDILSNRSFRFCIITNGLNLTQEIVDFVNAHDMPFSLSYDAPHPFAVRGYVSDKICALANRIKRLKIICSGCAYNCDPMSAYHCLIAKFPTAKHVIRTEVLRTFPEMDDSIDTYDVEALRISVKKIFIAAKLGDKFAVRYANKILAPLLHPEGNYFHNTQGVGICACGYKQITVTLDGKIPFCYNYFTILGSLTDDTLETVYQKACDIWHKAYDPECITCECKDLCYWGCMIACRDEKNHMDTCEKYRKPFFKIVKEEMACLTKPLNDEERDWYHKQEIIMDKQVSNFLKEANRHNIGQA